MTAKYESECEYGLSITRMSYKIVQTWEHNKHRLLAVPSTWEDNNILKYPRKNITKYLKIGTSIPEHDWKQIKCDVKRRQLPSYDTAEYVLQEMIKHTDTEDDITNSATSKQSKPELNLNIIADDIVNVYPNIQQNVINTNTFQESSVTYNHDVELKQKNTNATTVGPVYPNIQQNVKNLNTFQESSMTYHHDVALKQKNKNATIVEPAAENLNSELSYEYITIPMCGSESNVNIENLETFLTGQNTLLTNQSKILEQLNSIHNVQTTIIQKIASLSVQLDHAMVQINNLSQNSQVTPLSACKFSPANTAFNIKPIETVQQLDELELELSNNVNRQQKKQLYSVFFAGGKGIDCAYTLADVLFSRKFLCQCSWSGGSRGNNEAKIAWKAYKNILSFFWEIVNSWDNKYTVSHNVEFFQSILKNAKKRNMAKKERASTSRKRTKRSKNQSVSDDIESDEEETSVTVSKKPKIEKKHIEKNENSEESSSKQYIDRKGVVEEGIEEKGNDKESAKTLYSIIEKNECSIEGKDQEKRKEKNDITKNKIEEEQKNNKEKLNCPDSTIIQNKIKNLNEREENEKNTLTKKNVKQYEIFEEIDDSNIDENEESSQEEDEDHEREGDTSNDEESTIDSNKAFEKNYITQNKIVEEQEYNKKKMNCPISSIIQNKIKNLDDRVENEKNTFKKKKVEISAIFEENANIFSKTEDEKIDHNENINYLNSSIKHDETMNNESEKTIKENDEDTLKEINKEKIYEIKNAEVWNSVNVKIAGSNDKLEKYLNSRGENKEKDSDRQKEKVHGKIKLDYDFTTKENKNIVENQKQEKKRDRGSHFKSKKYMEK